MHCLPSFKLDSMPLTERQKIFVKAYACGLSYPEIAKVNGVGVGVVAYALSRARDLTGVSTTADLCVNLGLTPVEHKTCKTVYWDRPRTVDGLLNL